VAGIPIGTVMSRLARARQQLKRCLVSEEGSHGL
jgi:DNA-directed RNA polymerase specialized sigma24 family protein